MKPWEETWRADGRFVDDPTPDSEWNADFSWDGKGTATDAHAHLAKDDEARARLAAAAPDLARALLAVEWMGGGGTLNYCCPSCEAERVASGDRHHADCQLDAALRKAGVR